jgi:hypothetical protein
MNLNNPDDLNKYMDVHRSLERSLSTTIRIDHAQVDYIVVNRLIGIRNSPNQQSKVVDSMDAAIRFFLTEDEFEKYVVNQESLEE